MVLMIVPCPWELGVGHKASERADSALKYGDILVDPATLVAIDARFSCITVGMAENANRRVADGRDKAHFSSV